MKAIVLVLVAASLIGCSSMDVTKKDQLILDVPKELLIPPAPLKQL